MAISIRQIQTMFELELYSNITKICNLTLTVSEQKHESLSPIEKIRILLYYADSLYYTSQYAQAEEIYRQALQLRKSLKNKIKETIGEVISDVEIKYKLYLCYINLKKKNSAMEILQAISARSRTSKVNMALGNLYRDARMDRSAITCYKEVLRECPLALEATENLLRLGVKGVEVNSLIVDVAKDVSWLHLWLKAQAQLHSRDFPSALQSFKAMDTHGLLRDNTNLLVCTAYCYHYLCESEKAICALERATRLDTNLVFGRDLLSTLLATSSTEEHKQLLETLASTELDMSLWTSEYWVVFGNYMFLLKKFDKAAYYGQQALALQPGSIEALLLKAKCLQELNKYQEAANHCSIALQNCQFRYDVHHCLVESYLKLNRVREAEAMALNACQQLNYSPQSLTLHASVLLKDPMTSGKTVKKILEKATVQDKTLSTNAVYLLAEYLDQEQQYEQVKQLLLKFVEQYPTAKLHRMLGDCFVNLQKDEDAFHHYTITLRLDPNDQKAIEGLNLIGRSCSTNKGESYYSCVGETSYTSQETSEDHEVYAESDTDPWPTNSFEL